MKLVSLIQSCGVPFQIWSKDSIDRSKNLDWTSFGDAEKRKVLSKLPTYFGKILPPECSH